ncbi:MAG: hypothetical protein K2Q03_07490 [Sphingobacteriaceae bacterium]|nr:hypothetical protein [Sphingobacteriaceae bacterium]
MNEILNGVKNIKQEEYLFEFSICTLVTRKAEYEEMLASFFAKGFTKDTCEFLYIDNSESCTYDAYQGLNIFLKQAKGKYVILCHQDILIHDHDKNHLLARINEIEIADPKWGILANAGGVNIKWIGTQITTGGGVVIKEKRLPLRVKTVDENFMLIKNGTNIALSNNLSGFHLYGTDICLIAEILGFNAYIIDFNLIHKSDGNMDESFFKCRKKLIEKYRFAFRTRFMSTTCTRFCISGNKLTSFLYNFNIVKFFVRQYYKFFWPRHLYAVKTTYKR